MAKNYHEWMGRPITDPAHVDHLETSSALHEFHGGKQKHEAEDAAYDEYRKDQLAEAAAFHLNGLKGALGAGDRDAARRHGTMYGLTLKQLGHPIVGEPPPEVATKAKHMKDGPYKFRAHKADLFALPEENRES